jgi:hypothetical protein
LSLKVPAPLLDFRFLFDDVSFSAFTTSGSLAAGSDATSASFSFLRNSHMVSSFLADGFGFGEGPAAAAAAAATAATSASSS